MKEKEIHFLLSIVLFITILFLTSIFCVEDMQIKKVSFDDLTIFDFEVGAVGATECPFTFTDLECIDLI